ncbi:hypothetical protein Saa2_09377 [Streptomyces acidiscabies]|nr:hypothetical protein Saa2_09377 [Streptomyces acidiscabies]
MTAATDNRPSHRAISNSASARGSPTDTIPPRPANDPAIIRLRTALILAASVNDSPPATQAAAISPCECPTTAAGVTPSDCHTRANDTITAHNTGCTTSTRPNAPSSPNTSSRSHSTNGASARAHSAIRSANTGEDTSSPCAMPTHCEP